ncbi:MAG: radical SAM/SPASM domain-containing protein [Methylococcaceae bacterium]|nr:radical SAM/SPASM domain-containing protein [Methylococcaceae bacterium]
MSVTRKIPLFQQLEIETNSTCNRYCESCIRNSHPDREAVSSWFEPNLLPQAVFEEACHQAIALGFRGALCLQHYNEPLQDPRIIELGRFAKTLPFSQVFICSNADLIDEEKAQELDGVFDSIQIALYSHTEEQHIKREAWLRGQFKKTYLHFTKGVHIPTHFSPVFDTAALAAQYVERPCTQPHIRMILNHKGQMLLCCDDVVGNFNLGTFPETPLEDLWFNERHQEMLLTLQQNGGRKAYPYCETCPRP